MLDKAVLLITFNRPGTTRSVLSAIKESRPAKLYVFSDAPREGNDSDTRKVKEVRELFNNLEWNTELHLKFEERNLGCARGVSSAINWVFEKEEQAIILEDDCLPNPSFFRFCSQMLDKYAASGKVMHIAGTRWNPEFRTSESYLFSSIGHVWGWATWRRAWMKYDYEMYGWEKHVSSVKNALVKNLYVAFWTELFKAIAQPNQKHTWDYQWQYTLFKEGGLSVVPDVNLISNIGFEGVHSNYSNKTDPAAEYTHNRKVEEWLFNCEPARISQNISYDIHHMDNHFLKFTSRIQRLKKLLKYYVK